MFPWVSARVAAVDFDKDYFSLCYTTLYMDDWPVRQLKPAAFPPLLGEIPDPPKQLFAVGTLPPVSLPLLAVVGSRRYTTYGAEVVAHLIKGLAEYQVGIVSGLAIGIDTLAHEAALKHQLCTLAVPGSSLDRASLYPARNRALATKIVAAGGGLLSEYPAPTAAAPWTFPQRNRIMAGLSKATLLIEASERSGTLITARLAADYNREVLVVPGNIFSQNSFGTHQFLKLGATPVTSAADIADALGLVRRTPSAIPTQPSLPALSLAATMLIDLLSEPLPKDELIRRAHLSAAEANVALMQLELSGVVSQRNNLYMRVR